MTITGPRDRALTAFSGRDGRADTRGENHRGAKLTNRDVREIKEFLAGMAGPVPSYRALAAQYGVSRSTIMRIAKGQAWDHVRIRGSRAEDGDVTGDG